ncbi:hypothetical protein [Salinibacter phage 4_17]
MSNLKSLYRRLILFQPATGTKIDVPAERLLSTEIPVVQEERVSTADGTTRARGRTFRLPLRLAGEEEAQAARRMADAAGVQAILLGAPSTRQVVWAEGATLADVPEAAGPLTATAREVTLETTAFHADIGAGRDLFAGVPWEGTRPAPAVSLAPTGTDVSLSTNVTDGLTSIGDTASDLLGVSGGTTISEPIFGNTFASDSTNLNAARGIAFQEGAGNVFVLDEESSVPHGIEVYDTSGSFFRGGDYPGPGVPQSAAVASSLNLQRLFVADSGGTVEVVDPATYASIDAFTPQTSGDPAALAIRDHSPDAPPRAPLYVQTTEGVVEVYDWTEQPVEFIGVYDGGGFYDEVGSSGDVFNAFALHQGVLAGVSGTGFALKRLLAFQLASEQDPPRAARSFRVSETAEVGLDGNASGIQGDTPARLRMQAPIEGATVRLDAPSGDLLALDETGTQIGSAFAGDSLSVPAGTFFLEVTIDSASRRPALAVEDPGEATGVTAGTITGQEVESLFYFNQDDGAGGAGTTRETGGVSSFRPGSVPADAILFSRVNRQTLDVLNLLLKAGTAPAADFSFTIDLDGASQTKTLPAGESKQTFDIDAAVGTGTELRVTGQSTADSSLADVRCSFKVATT